MTAPLVPVYRTASICAIAAVMPNCTETVARPSWRLTQTGYDATVEAHTEHTMKTIQIAATVLALGCAQEPSDMTTTNEATVSVSHEYVDVDEVGLISVYGWDGWSVEGCYDGVCADLTAHMVTVDGDLCGPFGATGYDRANTADAPTPCRILSPTMRIHVTRWAVSRH